MSIELMIHSSTNCYIWSRQQQVDTCIFASNPVRPACSMFSDPAMSTSISLPPTDGTSKIICKFCKQRSIL